MISRIIFTVSLMLAGYLSWIDAQSNPSNFTEVLTINCTIGNTTYYGDECMESLGKFGTIVTWIVIGFLLTIVACCCGCLCCICKIFHSNKGRINRGRGGQVFSRQPDQAQTVTTVT